MSLGEEQPLRRLWSLSAGVEESSAGADAMEAEDNADIQAGAWLNTPLSAAVDSCSLPPVKTDLDLILS
jgi:hypothetical protein